MILLTVMAVINDMATSDDSLAFSDGFLSLNVYCFTSKLRCFLVSVAFMRPVVLILGHLVVQPTLGRSQSSS